MITCPYLYCLYEAETQEEIDDHAVYMASLNDDEHDERFLDRSQYNA